MLFGLIFLAHVAYAASPGARSMEIGRVSLLGLGLGNLGLLSFIYFFRCNYLYLYRPEYTGVPFFYFSAWILVDPVFSRFFPFFGLMAFLR